MNVIEKVFGTHSERELKRILPIVDKIESLRDDMMALTDEQLKAYAVHCRDTQFAMTPEDVLYRRLRIGQMNKAKTEEFLPKIKDVFEADASE